MVKILRTYFALLQRYKFVKTLCDMRNLGGEQIDIRSI